MIGILVINHYLKGEKFDELHRSLIESAKSLDIELIIKTNLEMLFCDITPDFVLFWDKDINLARSLENRGLRVFNSSNAIALCDDKAKTYLALENVAPQPKTIVAPLSYFKVDYTEFVQNAVEKLGLPVVFKECFGSFGEQVHLCNSLDEVMNCINGKPFLLQEYIETNSTDARLEIVGGRCVSAMKRHNENDFRSNITNGGTAEKYTPTEKEIDLAVKACNALGLDFGGVDILNGEYVCEVNSNAHIINLMNTTGVDVAPIIFKDIIEKL